MYGTFGEIVFTGLLSPRDFSTSLRAAYARHELIDGKPRLQRTGTDLEEISITFLFHASFCNPQAQLNALERMLRAGEIAPLTFGDGAYYGRFVLEEYSTNITQQQANGAIIAAEVSASLVEVANSDDAQARSSSLGFAVSNALPTTANFRTVLDGDAQTVGAAITATIAESTAVTSLVREAEFDSSLTASNLARADSVVQGQQTTLAGIQDAINQSASPIYAAASDLRLGLSAINGAVSTLQTALSTLDLSATLAAMPDYQLGMTELRTLSTKIAVLQATRT